MISSISKTFFLWQLFTYSGVSNNQGLHVYLFPKKRLLCVFISPAINSTMTVLCVYLVLGNNLPCALIPYRAIIRYSRVPRSK